MTGRKQKYGWKPRGRMRFRRRYIDWILSPLKGDSQSKAAVSYTLAGTKRAMVVADKRDAIVAARVLKALKASKVKVSKASYDPINRRMVIGNPPSARRIKMARVAFKLAYKLYKQFKGVGVPRFVINRVPAEIRPYVIATLDFNGIKIIG